MSWGGVSPLQSWHAGQGGCGGSTLSLVVDVLPLHRFPDHVVKKIIVSSRPANTRVGRFRGAPRRVHTENPTRLLPMARH